MVRQEIPLHMTTSRDGERWGLVHDRTGLDEVTSLPSTTLHGCLSRATARGSVSSYRGNPGHHLRDNARNLSILWTAGTG